MADHLSDVERRLREHLAAVHALTAEIAAIRGEGSDDADLVHATMGTGGKVLGLTLDPRVMRMPSQDLAQHVMAALEAARLDVEQQIQAAMANAVRTNKSWEEILSDDAPIDMAAALPPLPDPDAFDELIRASRRDGAAG